MTQDMQADRPQLTVIALGSAGAGKSYTFRSMAFMDDLSRSIVFPPDIVAMLREDVPPTVKGLNYTFMMKDYSTGLEFDCFAYDPVGGEINRPSPDSEVLADIKERYNGGSFILLCIDPKDLFTTQSDREFRLQMLIAWLTECKRGVDVGTAPYIAVCFTKCDEYGIHYSECGRMFGDEHTQEILSRGKAKGFWADFGKREYQARHRDDALGDLVHSLLSLSEKLIVHVMREGYFGQNVNLYLTAACPHVPDAAQLGAQDSSVLAGNKALATTSAGLADAVSDWARWVCDFRHEEWDEFLS